jgi:hypothetical protein
MNKIMNTTNATARMLNIVCGLERFFGFWSITRTSYKQARRGVVRLRVFVTSRRVRIRP